MGSKDGNLHTSVDPQFPCRTKHAGQAVATSFPTQHSQKWRFTDVGEEHTNGNVAQSFPRGQGEKGLKASGLEGKNQPRRTVKGSRVKDEAAKPENSPPRGTYGRRPNKVRTKDFIPGASPRIGCRIV